MPVPSLTKSLFYFIMNYQRIYDQIINRARIRALVGYKERHHILPKCLGGLDEACNLVNLTAREHFICHRLLTRLHPDNKSLAYAFWMMCNKKSSNQERYTPTSREYEEARTLYTEATKGRKHTEEAKEKNRLSHLGKSPSDVTREKMSKAQKGRKHTEDTKQKIAEANRGRHHSDSTKQLLSEKNSGNVPWNKGKVGAYSEETRQKWSSARKGITKSPESVQKMLETKRLKKLVK